MKHNNSFYTPNFPFIAGKSSWPWSPVQPMYPQNFPASDFPRISVVTPSFNQGQFIEETIRSVLLQGYPNLEYIIIDGGSTDGSADIIKKYSTYLRYWQSQKDSGQSDAINQGLQMATGEIVGWLNSDDWYEPGTLNKVGEFFVENQEKNIVMGDCHLVNQDDLIFDNVLNNERGLNEIIRFWEARSIPTQPALFFRKKLLEIHGYLDPSLYYAMDYDLWLRFSRDNHFYHIDQFFANYRFHPNSKGGDQKMDRFLPEWRRVFRRYAGINLGLWLNYTWVELRSYIRNIKYWALSNYGR